MSNSEDVAIASQLSGNRKSARGAFVRALSLLSPSGYRSRLTIFTYHRVLSQTDAWLPGEPDAVFFSQQMKWIAEFCNVLPLPDAVAMLAHNSLPARAACITLDDGYANNLEIALPILRMQGLPATVFVAVDAVERGIMWNDLVIEALRRAGSEIDLTHLGLGILKITTDTERAQAVTKTLGSLKYLPAQERWTRANELWQRWGSGSFPRLMMTTEQVRALSRAGIDVGGHTVNHPILAKLGDDEAQSEISSCRDWVAATTGRAPLSFAYPNGRPGLDYLPQHAAMVEKAGFALAATTCWGCATSRAHAFELPRISPWDRSRNRFFARLAQIYLQSYQKQTHHTAIEY